jgi:hypothetical protein
LVQRAKRQIGHACAARPILAAQGFVYLINRRIQVACQL